MQTSNYKQALALVHDALSFGTNPSLEGVQRVCELLGNPQQRYVCVQVAGTNGKSSTSRYLAALLQAHGFSVGLYTSPELVQLTERIKLSGKMISQEDFGDTLLKVYQVAQSDGLTLTEFELLTVTALEYYAQEKVEVAVLEVGLGGRWDATSVVSPALAVITGIAFDHTDILGDTLAQIAAEKAAIIKPKTVALAAPLPPEALKVVEARAREVDAPLFLVPKQDSTDYQQQNKAVARVAARLLFSGALNTSYKEENAEEALATTVVPGRFETLRADPLLMIDAAHNPQSAQVLARALTASTLPLKDMTLLLGILDNKDATGIITELVPLFGATVLSQSSSPRAFPAAGLATLAQAAGFDTFQVEPCLERALAQLTRAQTPVLATGSITLAGQVKALTHRTA